MKIITTNTPSPHQFAQAEELCRLCCQSDAISLCFPYDGDFYGFAKEGDELLAMLSLFQEQEHLYTLSAFTKPDRRHTGLFSALLETAVLWLEHTDEDAEIDIITDPNCHDALLTLQALEAEHLYDDLLMNLTLANKSWTSISSDNSLGSLDSYFIDMVSTHDIISHPDFFEEETATDLDPDSKGYVLQKKDSNEWLSMAILSDYSKQSFWLHHVQTPSKWRHQGMASKLLSSLLDLLSLTHPDYHIKLHVSSDNLYALHLYKKAGFQTIQTLSHYFY